MIEFLNINKSFGSFKVLDNLSLQIKPGKITYIIGKSGEGKSVTIKHMMGLLRPDSGKIFVDGKDLDLMNETELHEMRKKFGLLFQHGALFDSLNVFDNIAFPLREHFKLNKSEIKNRVDEVLEKCDIDSIVYKSVEELSTGEKKRVGLARALVTKPLILLYDEPTTGMDPIVSQMIDDLIVKVSQEEQGMTSVVISHDIKATMTYADEIIMLYKGRVELGGSPLEFLNTTNPVIRQFFSGQINGPMEFL